MYSGSMNRDVPYTANYPRRLQHAGSKTLDYSYVSEPRAPESVANRPRRQNIKTEKSMGLLDGDSLQLFQQQLNAALNQKKKPNRYTTQFPREDRKSRAIMETMQLKKEVEDIKNLLQNDGESKNLENKLEKLLLDIDEQKNSTVGLTNPPTPQQVFIPPMPYQQPPNPYYIPFPMYQPPPTQCSHHYERPRRRRRPRMDDSEQSQSSEQRRPRRKPRKSSYSKKTALSSRSNNVFSRDRARAKLRKIFFVVAYTIFIRSETKKLSQARKSNMKRFWADKFESQMGHIKNWILEAFKYSLSIVLEKSKLNFKFFNENSQKVRMEKQKLIMQVLNIGITKLLEESTPQKISVFAEILYYLCFRGSFAVGRFWTAFEMEQVCVSECFGFIRADQNTQKFFLGVLVFFKVFTYNMLLQPYKFDSRNFPKNVQPISGNMKTIGSVFYHMMKEVIEKYRTSERDPQIYKIGNWLSIPKEFIVECSEPLVINNSYPEGDEYISGLFTAEQIESIKQLDTWQICQQKLRKIVDKLYAQMRVKAKLMRKNLKYKMYN